MSVEANITRFREDVLAMARALRTHEEDAMAERLAEACKHIVLLQQQVQTLRSEVQILQNECMQLRNRK